jgi:hypothetical protein
MKKICFIGNYLDEWHVNLFLGWIRAAPKGEWDVALARGEEAKPGRKAIDA